MIANFEITLSELLIEDLNTVLRGQAQHSYPLTALFIPFHIALLTSVMRCDANPTLPFLTTSLSLECLQSVK